MNPSDKDTIGEPCLLSLCMIPHQLPWQYMLQQPRNGTNRGLEFPTVDEGHSSVRCFNSAEATAATKISIQPQPGGQAECNGDKDTIRVGDAQASSLAGFERLW